MATAQHTTGGDTLIGGMSMSGQARSQVLQAPYLPTEQNKSDPNENEPTYGGFSRFEIELEFVQSLANPFYLNHLATQKYFSDPTFVAYLAYLRYWSSPPYLKYLSYPGPTLKHLELLQSERFRADIISPEVVQVLCGEDIKASVDWAREE